MFGASLFSTNSNSTSFTEKKYEDEFYSASFKSNLGDYIFNIHLKHDKILFDIESEIEYLSLYTYSKEMTFEELIKLSNNFKSCNNIEQIFESFINIMKGITFKINNETFKSKVEIKFLEEDSLIMYVTIPLIYRGFDNFEIKFEKKQKNLLEQYEKLRTKYLKIRDLISCHDCYRNYYDNNKSLISKVKTIEEE